MIVEDEPLIRAGLKQYFNWQEIGFHTIFEAENGREGISIALRECPDLIITDIRMPEVDGLQMIERLRPLLPHTLFIILTGFNDFHYAQNAIRLGNIHDYLLKPLQYEESLASIINCKRILELKREENQTRSLLSTIVIENSKLMSSQTVKAILEDECPIQEETIIRLHGIQEKIGMVHSFVMSFLPHSADIHLTRSVWRARAESTMTKIIESIYPLNSNHQIMNYSHRSKIYTLVLFEELESLIIDNLLEEQINQNLVLASTEFQASFYLAASNPTTDLPQVSMYLQHAEKALYQRFCRPSRQFFLTHLSEPIRYTAKDSISQLNNDDKNLVLTCLEHGDAVQTKMLLERIAQQSIHNSHSFSPDKWLTFIQEIISVTLRFAHRNDIPVEGVYSAKLLNLTFVDDFRTIEELCVWIADWIIQLNSVYQVRTQNAVPPEALIFGQIEAFIEQNIDKEVTLQMVADRFFYNPSYLSRLFKQKLNKNYMTFLTEIRIRYAKQYLKDPKALVTDVCIMCGYKSYKHFVKTFRNVTQMTPTEYRKQLGL